MITFVILHILTVLICALGCNYYINKYNNHSMSLEDALIKCNLNMSVIDIKTGIYCDRYILQLGQGQAYMSYLDFYQFSSMLCKYTKKDCAAYKKDDYYIVDINKERHDLSKLNTVCSQTNYYNIYDFQGEKLLINIFHNIMLININTNFFINTIKNQTTNCIFKDNMSINDILSLIEQRKHMYFRTNENTKGLPYVFAFIYNDHDQIPFILKHSASVKVFVILVGNQSMVYQYHTLVDYIFYHGDDTKNHQLKKVLKTINVNFSDSKNDILIFNKYFKDRVCII
jgi:hypothetical protein